MLNLGLPFGRKDDDCHEEEKCERDDKYSHRDDDCDDKCEKDDRYGRDDRDHHDKYSRNDDCDDKCEDDKWNNHDKYSRNDDCDKPRHDDCDDKCDNNGGWTPGNDDCPDMHAVLASMSDVSSVLDFAVGQLDTTPTYDTLAYDDALA